MDRRGKTARKERNRGSKEHRKERWETDAETSAVEALGLISPVSA